MIRKLIAQVKAAATLPEQVDSATTWTDVTASGPVLTYHYDVAASVPSTPPYDGLESQIVAKVCAPGEVRDATTEGVVLRYLHTFANDGAMQEFSVAETDCVAGYRG